MVKTQSTGAALISQAPLIRELYRLYRSLPAELRAPLRAVAKPRRSLIAATVRMASGGKVVRGPFRGMRLGQSPNTPHGYLGYITGSHEIELERVIECIATKNYATIFNIGAADGYYAIGLARRLTASRVVAFEADCRLHFHLAATAKANRIDRRLEIRGRCEVDTLALALEPMAGRTLIVVDIEGGEADILDPNRVPPLRNVDLLVETHDHVVPRCTETIAARFSATHDIERFRARKRALSDFPSGFLQVLPRLAPDTLVNMMDEGRAGPQEWLFLTAKDDAAGGIGFL